MKTFTFIIEELLLATKFCDTVASVKYLFSQRENLQQVSKEIQKQKFISSTATKVSQISCQSFSHVV